MEGVNELESGVIPLLASRQGGEGCVIKKISRSRRSSRSRGGFPFALNRKTTPASRSAEVSRHFSYRSATPPCGDARRGVALRSICSQLHRPPLQRGNEVWRVYENGGARSNDSYQNRTSPWTKMGAVLV